MWAKRILLSITLLGLLNGAKSQLLVKPGPFIPPDISPPIEQANCKYILATPTVLPSGKTGQVCVFIDCEETVQVDVRLEYQFTSISLFNNQITSQFFECKDVPVPTVTTVTLAYVTFSAIGNTVEKRERKGVAIDNMPASCFVQTEKKLYRPGDTVRSRAFCLNYDLKPTEQKFTRVRLLEPTGACVQIIDLLSESYVASAEVTLSEDASPGGYNLIFERESGNPVSKYVTVQRYRLPRFDSTVTCPNTLSILDKSAKIDISAKYVYGKPLPATVIIKCCRNKAYNYGRAGNCYKGLEDICEEFTGELDDTGAYTNDLSLDIYKLQFSEYSSSLQCTVTIKEAGTGVLDTKYCYMYISSQPINLQIDYSYTPQFYKRGLEFPFAVTLTDEKSQPLAYKSVSIDVDGLEIKTVTTDAQGRAECAIDTSQYFKANFTIRASYLDEDQCYVPSQSPRWSPVFSNSYDPGYPHAERIVYRFFAETDSFLQIKKETQGELTCSSTLPIEVKYKVTKDGVGKGATSTTFYYLVKARGQIVLHGKQDVDLSTSLKGSFSINLLITPKYAKSAKVLVFGAMKTEIISDYLEFSVESCFDNQVSLTFTESIVAPGSEVEQEITAAPGSLCGLRASDASLDLLQSYDDFNRDSIYYSLEYYNYGLQVQNYDLGDPEPPCEDPSKEVFCHGRYYLPYSSTTDGDTYSNLVSMSLIVASELRVRKPQVCGMEQVNTPIFATIFASDSVQSFAGGFSAAKAGSIETVRSNFDEAFGWQIVITGTDGKGIATSTIPDTITEWKSDMFCVSQTEGVGFTNQTAKITTFLPFFGELTMPQYCTRGEKLIITTTAVNYEDDCKKVSFSVTASDDSQATSLSGDEEICICNGESASKQWSMDFTSLGEVNLSASVSTTHISDSCDGPNDDSKPSRTDTVIKPLQVEAEGVKREVTFSHLAIVKDTTSDIEVTIESPDNLVEGSFQIYFTVVGDTVGLMAANLINLLSQPDGCCEQNLARILPVAFLLNYLNSTNQLDDDLREKAQSYLSSGYARQLACRSWDGQYSVFRNSHVPNSWLSINTFFAFEQTKPWAYIDESVQQQTLLQLGRTQDLSTGCFSPTGSLFTVQDDYNNTLRYTAYVAKRLLKSNLYGIGETLLEGCLRCIQAADYETLDIYTLAYVFEIIALAKLDRWEEVYAIVQARAITEGGTIYWRRENILSGRPYYFLPIVYASAEVDITATMMLGILHGPVVNQEKLDELAQIATWLSQRQNAYGGYISSQDTVTSVEAITEYGLRVYVDDTDVNIFVALGDIQVAQASVTKDNKMLVQRIPLPVEFGIYTVTTSGKGNPLIQITAKFNTKVTNEGSEFSLTVTTRTESCTEGVAPVIYTDICASYNGDQQETNMILIDIKELTGYSTDRGSFYNILSADKISDVVFKDNHVYLYLNSLKAGIEVCHTITSYLDMRALLYQSSTIILQDYYNPDKSAYADYSYPCSPLVVE